MPPSDAEIALRQGGDVRASEFRRESLSNRIKKARHSCRAAYAKNSAMFRRQFECVRLPATAVGLDIVDLFS